MGLVLLLVVIILLVGAAPQWPHARSWGYTPSGILGVTMILLIILLVLRIMPFV